MLTRHKWIGMSILMLVVLRLLWRWTNTVPAAPPGMPGWQIGAARLSHISLYALLIIQPLAGWMMSSAKALSVTWFGLFTFPDLVPPSQQTFELMHEIHEVCAMLILVLAALHVAAALKHHFVDHDDVLRRMLPMRLRRKG
jgi:cytochrome b561